MHLLGTNSKVKNRIVSFLYLVLLIHLEVDKIK